MDLADWTDSLRRMVATAGTFDTVYPDTTDDDLIGALLDGLAEAQLDGFFRTPTMYSYTSDGIVTPDMMPDQMALVVIYAGVRLIQATLLNRAGSVTYKAGTLEYQQQYASNVLTSILNELNTRKTALLTQFQLLGAGQAFIMADQYFIKAVGYYPGFYGYDDDYSRALDYASPYGNE